MHVPLWEERSTSYIQHDKGLLAGIELIKEKTSMNVDMDIEAGRRRTDGQAL